MISDNMVHTVTAVCKYAIIILVFIYTVDSFLTLKLRRLSRLKKKYAAQKALTYTVLLLTHTVMYLNTGDYKFIIYYFIELLYMVFYSKIFMNFYPKACMLYINHMMMLLTIGLSILERLDPSIAKRQMLLILVATVVSLPIPAIVERLKNMKTFAAAVGVLGLLSLVGVFALGATTYGANLSISIGPITIQPSEFVKVTFVFLIAMLFRKRNDFKRVVFATAIAAAHVFVLVLSTDLGSALIFFIAYLLMLFTATEQFKYLFAGLGAGGVAAVGAYYMFSHVRQRVSIWIDPWADVENKGYQIVQSLFAIGSGKWFGTGLYEGQPGDIPIVSKDFTFSAICEEMGVIVACCLILICLSLLLMIVVTVSKMKVMFYRLIGLGLASIYGTQVFLTVGGVIKFIPMTGVTLPLVSYGGSSVLSTYVMLGVLQGLYILKRIEDEEIDKREHEEKLLKQLFGSDKSRWPARPVFPGEETVAGGSEANREEYDAVTDPGRYDVQAGQQNKRKK